MMAPAHRDCDINVKLIYKIPVTFHNLKISILLCMNFNLEINSLMS